MKKVYEDKERIVLMSDEENLHKDYTILNMGNYVGHRNRSIFELAPEYWKLMFYTEADLNSNKQTNVEALIDEQGNYIRILVEQFPLTRVLLIDDKTVLADWIIDGDCSRKHKSGILYKASVDEISGVSLDDYLMKEHPLFYYGNTKTECFLGNYPTNNYIISFLQSGTAIKEKIAKFNTRKLTNND